MANCAFCNQNRKLTREHVFSNAVLRVFDSQAPLTYLGHKVFKADPVIKDLCTDCNTALSSYDNAMKQFAEAYLRVYRKPPWNLPSEDKSIRLWVLKTAMNFERAQRQKDWWRGFIPNLMQSKLDPDLDVFFAPWCDLSPGYAASAWNVVRVLDGRTALIAGSTVGPWKELERSIRVAWVIKLGYGVFLMIAWEGRAVIEVRATAVTDLLNWGWCLLGYDRKTRGVPYSAETCGTISVVADPRRPIKAIMREEDRAQHPVELDRNGTAAPK